MLLETLTRSTLKHKLHVLSPDPPYDHILLTADLIGGNTACNIQRPRLDRGDWNTAHMREHVTTIKYRFCNSGVIENKDIKADGFSFWGKKSHNVQFMFISLCCSFSESGRFIVRQGSCEHR